MHSSLGVRDGELTLALDWPQRAKQSRSLAHSYSPGSMSIKSKAFKQAPLPMPRGQKLRPGEAVPQEG